jgi:uncharacterized protein (UPF0335 family)
MNILKYAHLKNLWENMIMVDEIIKELWKIKDAISNEHGYDVKALVVHLKAKKREGDQQVVNLRHMKKSAEPSRGEGPGIHRR